MTLVLNKYNPALILSPINSFGFSTNFSIYPSSCDIITPYFEGSSTFVTKMVP